MCLECTLCNNNWFNALFSKAVFYSCVNIAYLMQYQAERLLWIQYYLGGVPHSLLAGFSFFFFNIHVLHINVRALRIKKNMQIQFKMYKLQVELKFVKIVVLSSLGSLAFYNLKKFIIWQLLYGQLHKQIALKGFEYFENVVVCFYKILYIYEVFAIVAGNVIVLTKLIVYIVRNFK